MPGNDVRINDVSVGQVRSIGLEGLDAKVTFSVDPDVTLGTATRAEIRQASLLGDRYIALTPGDGARLAEGDTLPRENTARAGDVEGLLAAGAGFAAPLSADDVNQVLWAFDRTYGGDPEKLGRLIDAAAQASATFRSMGDELAATIDQVDAMTAAMAPHTEELAASLQRFADGFDALAAHSGGITAFVAELDSFSTQASDLLARNRDALAGFGGNLTQVLGEVHGSLAAVDEALLGLYDFNAAWACIGDGNFLNQTFLLLPEVATVDYGPGHCDPEVGQRSRTEDGQVVIGEGEPTHSEGGGQPPGYWAKEPR